MKWDNENIKNMVDYVNSEIDKGRKLADVCIMDFAVNYRSIKARFKKEGYCMSADKFVDEQELKVTEDEKNNVIEPGIVDIEKLVKLVDLLEPLEKLLEQENAKSESELPQIRYLDIAQKTFKVDSEILKKWELFCKAKKGYKMQDLTSRALQEYMQNQGW